MCNNQYIYKATMASSKTWKGPVFGSQSVRFSGNGLHPNLLTTGRMPYDIKSAAVYILHLVLLIDTVLTHFL